MAANLVEALKLIAYISLTGLTTVSSPTTVIFFASLTCQTQLDLFPDEGFLFYGSLLIEYICARLLEKELLKTEITIWVDPQ